MKFANQKLILAGVVAAIMLSGCGKKTPTGTAAPVTFGDDEEIANPVAPSTVPDEAYPSDTLPAIDNTQMTNSETPAAEPAATDGADDKAKADADAAKKAEEDAAAKKKAEADAIAAEKLAQADRDAKAKEQADAAAKAKADRIAKEKAEAEQEAKEKAAEIEDKTPAFKKVIGEGSLHSANGVAIASGILYVVDNARQGLLGKFAAVRSYTISTGDFQSSFENIGWAGAKNMPTSVDRVKIADGKVHAGDDTATYKFNMDGTLAETAEDDFELGTEADVADSDDAWRIKSGKVVRVDEDGDVILTLPTDHVSEPIALTVDNDGNLYVSDAVLKAVVVFAAPEK